MRTLAVIYERIEARAREVAAAREDWPCRRGCDECCRRLAAPPEATRAEWERVWAAYLRLDERTRAAVRERVEALKQSERTAASSGATDARYVCPLLDPAEGACLVYADRPAACRMYGFFVARDGGRYCGRIETFAPRLDVVWGNHEGVEHDLRRLSGPPVSILDWFATRT